MEEIIVKQLLESSQIKFGLTSVTFEGKTYLIASKIAGNSSVALAIIEHTPVKD